MKKATSPIRLLPAAVLLAVLAGPGLPARAQMEYYRIGNSLTWQSSPAGIQALFTTRGFTGTTSGYHVNCGSSLINTWNNPASTCAGIPSSPSTFPTALPGRVWWAVTAQPFQGATSTLGTDAQVVTNLVGLMDQNSGNTGTPMYLFNAHGFTSPTNTYQELWTQSVPHTGDAQATVASREYYDRLVARLTPLLPPGRLSTIPAGAILYELDVRMKAGLIPGYSDVYALYSDTIHLNNEGDYIEGCATFAALTGQDPWGLTAPANYGTVNFTPAQYNAVHDTIWQVLRNDPNCRPVWHSENWPYKINRAGHFGDAIVRTNGTLVAAVNLGSSANVTVNGVPFTGSLARDGLDAAHASATVYGDGSVTAEFETLLDSFAYHQDTTNPGTADLVLTGLTPGRRYEVQLFVADQRNAVTRSRRIRFTLQGKSVLYAQEGLGFSVTGAFTATAAAETLILEATAGTGDSFQGAPMLNAFQVRQADSSAPDPDPAPVPTGSGIARTWIGTANGSTDFSTAGQWNPSGAVTGTDVAVFAASGSGNPSQGGSVTLGGFQFNSDAAAHTSPGISATSFTFGGAGRIITNNAATEQVINVNRSGGPYRFFLQPGTSEILHNGADALTLGSSQVLANGAAVQATGAGVGTLAVSGSGPVTLGGISGGNLALQNGTAALALHKSGPGMLTLTGANNTFTGGAVLAGGVVLLNATGYTSANTNGVLGSGPVTLRPGGELRVQGNFNLGKGQVIYLAGGELKAVNGANYLHDLRITEGGSVSTGGGGFAFGYAQNSAVTLSGTQPAEIRCNLQFVKSTGTQVTFTVADATGDDAPDLTLSGTLFDNASYKGLTLVKSGPGRLTLGGTNTYSGATTVTEGLLDLPGSVTSPVTVRAFAKIRGTGTVQAAVVVEPDAFIIARLPGPPLKVIGDLAVAGTLQLELGDGFGPGTHTVLTCTGTLTNNGLLLGAMPSPHYTATLDPGTAGEVRVVVAHTPFAAWQMEHFGCLDCPEAAENATPQDDRVPNLVKYALGLDPKVPCANPIEVDRTDVAGKTHLRLRVLRDPMVTDVLIEGLSAGTLFDPAAWSVNTTFAEVDTENEFKVRDTVPVEAPNPRYMKLRFTLP